MIFKTSIQGYLGKFILSEAVTTWHRDMTSQLILRHPLVIEGYLGKLILTEVVTTWHRDMNSEWILRHPLATEGYLGKLILTKAVTTWHRDMTSQWILRHPFRKGMMSSSQWILSENLEFVLQHYIRVCTFDRTHLMVTFSKISL